MGGIGASGQHGLIPLGFERPDDISEEEEEEEDEEEEAEEEEEEADIDEDVLDMAGDEVEEGEFEFIRND